MLTTQQPTIGQLADRLVRVRSLSGQRMAARALVARVDADCFTELVSRSTLSGRLTPGLFRLLSEAFDVHVEAHAMRRQAVEIAALPETA